MNSGARLRTWRLGVLLTAAAALPLLAQDVPTFRSGVQLIEVDVRVTDDDGRPVRGLTKKDFTVLDDGVPQTISTLSFVDLAVESPITRRLPDDIESDVVTNAGNGRMWVMLLGGFGLKAQIVARQFVTEAMGPYDQVAVVPLNGNMSSAQGFTRNRLLLLNAVDRLQVDDPFPFPDVNIRPANPWDDDEPVRIAYETLENQCRRLSLVSGRRKSIIFFDPPKTFILSAGNSVAYRDAIRCATRNNIAVYVVATDGMGTELGQRVMLGMAGQRILAEDTGGDAIVNTNNFEGGYARFIRESNEYYLIGFTPSVPHRDGEFHNLTVRVDRRDVTVRTRRGYYAPAREPAVKPTASPEPAKPGLSADARDALRMPLSIGGLSIDLSAALFRGTGGNGTVLLTARVRGPELSLGAGDLIEVGYQATTTGGRTTPGAFHVFKMDLLEGSRAAAASQGLRFVDWLTLPRGRHQVRFVVHQPNGKTGMVVADVDVPDFSDVPVSMSGIVIAALTLNAQPTLKMDEPLKKLLGGTPTAERSFSRRDMLTAYAEIYTNQQTRPDSVVVTAAIARTTDLKRPRAIQMTPAANAPGRVGWLGRLGLRDIQPGEYVLTFEASRLERRVATRQVLITVTN